MRNENILIFQKPFRFVSIHFFLSWLSQEREETWRKRGTGVLGWLATMLHTSHASADQHNSKVQLLDVEFI